MTRYSEEVKRYYPYLVGMLIDDGFFAAPSSSGGGSGGTTPPDVTGYVKADGSVPFTGNVQIASGKTIDGVDLSAFKSSYDGHLTGDSHPRYAEAEGYGTRAATWANRLNKSILAGVGMEGGGLLDNNRTVSVDEDYGFVWTSQHIFNGGARIGAAVSLQFGTDTALARGGADFLVTSDSFRALRLGANRDPSHPLHVRAQAADSKIASFEDQAGVEQIGIDYLGEVYTHTGRFLSPEPPLDVYGYYSRAVYRLKANKAYSVGVRNYPMLLQIVDSANNEFFAVEGHDNSVRLRGELQGGAWHSNTVTISAGKNDSGSYYDPAIAFGDIYSGNPAARLGNGRLTIVNNIAFSEDSPGNDHLQLYNAGGVGGAIGMHPYFGRIYLQAAWGANTQIVSNGSFQIRTLNDAYTPLILKARATQSANLFQLRNSADGVQGYIDASYNWGLGIASGINPDVRLRSRHATEQLRLENTATKYTRFLHDSNDDLTIEPGNNLILQPLGDLVFNPDGKDIVPYLSYDLNLGTPFKKFLTVHAAELHVETLVAQDVLATVGGRVLVIPTSLLTRDITDTDTTIYVKHNQARAGDVLRLEAHMRVEFMAVTAGPTEITPGVEYSYTVTRSLDPTGANPWYEGDGIVNTGITGSGYLDLFAIQGAAVLSPDYIFNTDGFGTFSANLRDERDFTLFGSAVTGGAVYVGNPASWRNLYLTIAQADNGQALIIPEFWNGTMWDALTYTTLEPSGIGTNFLFNAAGLFGIEWTTATGWTATTINGINAYWIRLRIGSTAAAYTRPLHGNRRVFMERHVFGPTMAAMVRNSSTYNDIIERAAMGNLNGLYGYGRDIFGFAAGKYQQSYLTADEVNGLRLFSQNTLMGHWKIDGTLIVGPEAENHLKATATYLDFLDAAGNIYTHLESGLLRLGVSSVNHIRLTGSSLDFRSNTLSLAELSGSSWRIGLVTSKYTLIDGTSIRLLDNGTVLSEFAGGLVTIGETGNEHVRISSTGVELKDASVVYGKFAATTTLGRTDQHHAEISSTGFRLKDSSGNILTEVTAGKVQVGRKAHGFSWLDAEASKIAMRVQKGVTVEDMFWFDNTGAGFLNASLTVNSSGFIKLGRDYASGSGIWMGYDTVSGFLDTYKMVIGDSTAMQMQWDGAALVMRSANGANRVEFGGTGISAYESSNLRVLMESAGLSLHDSGNLAALYYKTSGSTVLGQVGLHNVEIAASSFEQRWGIYTTKRVYIASDSGATSQIDFILDEDPRANDWFSATGVVAQMNTSTFDLFLSTNIGTTTANKNLAVHGNLSVRTDYYNYRGGSDRAGGITHIFSSAVTALSNSARTTTGGVSGTNVYEITVTSHSIPAGCRAVLVRLTGESASTGNSHYVGLRRHGNSDFPVVVRSRVASITQENSGIVPINSSNEKISLIVNGSTNTCSVEFYGYIS